MVPIKLDAYFQGLVHHWFDNGCYNCNTERINNTALSLKHRLLPNTDIHTYYKSNALKHENRMFTAAKVKSQNPTTMP